jgi:antitoxin VapB
MTLEICHVPLYIADAEVGNLAREVQQILKARTLTEAVRTALQHEMERARTIVPLKDRIRKCQDEYAALGPDNPNIDLKAFFDEMWESG